MTELPSTSKIGKTWHDLPPEIHVNLQFLFRKMSVVWKSKKMNESRTLHISINNAKIRSVGNLQTKIISLMPFNDRLRMKLVCSYVLKICNNLPNELNECNILVLNRVIFRFLSSKQYFAFVAFLFYKLIASGLWKVRHH